MQREQAVESGWSARVTCASCGYSRSQQLGESGWVGPVWVVAHARCGGCSRALVRRTRRESGVPRRSAAALRCSHCGATTPAASQTWTPVGSAAPVDPYFGLPLWLQTACCGEVLWAVNVDHLAFLENYVVAKLRERVPNQNGSVVSRLPKWLKEARHRKEIIACIAQLRRSLVDAGPDVPVR
ncbi:MAG TPA: hypothetical protein VGP25_13815 [Gemmatimonadaceae bacterium]|nr:hypothetical protein [Gemmatimonadaceae bacterium]